MKYIAGAIIALGAGVVLFFVFAYSGIYNISAAEPHNSLTKWVINTVKDNSIEHHSKNIQVPDLNNPANIMRGFTHYREMCAGCHGAPGRSRSEIGQGLYPKGPSLARSAEEMPPQQLFWITKNGIKLTGMPSFGKTHSDEKIWNIVSFLKKLPGMTKTSYDSLDTAAKNIGDDD